MILQRHAGENSAHLGAKDIGWQALGPALGCTLLAVSVVATRWYTRWKVANCVGLDDYVILVSVVCTRKHSRIPTTSNALFLGTVMCNDNNHRL
jgi:hypothetical protein